MVQQVTENVIFQSTRDMREITIHELLQRASEKLLAINDELASLRADVERLRSENLELKSERDQHVKTIQAMLPKPEPITEQEVETILRDNVTFDQVLQDLEELQGA